METKNLSNSTYKCVLVVDNARPTGIITDIASVSSVALGYKVNNIISHDVYDKQGEKHLGITQLPVPISGASQEKMKEIHKLFNSLKIEELVSVGFSTVAQQSGTYDEYERKAYNANEADLHYVGIGICAEKKIADKVTGYLGLIR